MTRTKIDIKDDNIIINQGVRKIQINISNQKLTECNFESSITIIRESNKILIHAYPILTYLGAYCDFKDSAFCILMPANTLWETWGYIDFDKNNIDIYEINGGKNNVVISLTCDILIDMMFGHGFFVNVKDYINDAIFEALNINIYQYNSAKEKLKKINTEINDFVNGNKNLKSLIDVLDNTASIEKDIIKEIIFPILENRVPDLKWNYSKSIQFGRYEEAKQFANEIYDNSKVKLQGENITDFLELIDIALLFVDIYETSLSLSKYNEDIKYLLKSVFSEDTVKYLGISENEYFYCARSISNIISSKENINRYSLGVKISEFIIDKTTTWVNQGVLKAFIGKSAGSISLAYELSKIIVENLIFKNTIKAFSADLKAMFLSELQQNIYYV